jgi:hypothetical protein
VKTRRYLGGRFGTRMSVLALVSLLSIGLIAASQIGASASPASLTLTPNSVTGGNSPAGTIQLTDPAPSGGVQFMLKSSDDHIASTPARVMVAAGSTTVSFVVSTQPVSSSQDVKIGAWSSSLHARLSATLTVTPDASSPPPPPPSPPANTAPPTVSGSAVVGQALNATSGSWSGTTPISYAYQWLRCNSSGASCSSISGATASSYTPVTADVASTLRAQVTASNSAGQATAQSAQTQAVQSAAASTFGTTTVGTATDYATADLKEVSVYSVAQAGSVSKLTGYISGLGASSGSQRLRAVLYADSSGSPGALLGTSNEITVAGGKAWGWVDFPFPSAISISAGKVWMGYIATSTSNLTQLRYSSVTNELHYNNNSYSSGASSPFGTPKLASMHYSLYGTYASTSSASTLPVNTTAPTVSGSAVVGQALNATSGSWSGTTPISYAYQWLRCNSTGGSCSSIAGATTSAYTSVTADVGSTLRAQVTASNSAGQATAQSAQTQVMQAAPSPSPSPGAGLANLWVGASGTCARSASPVAYSAATSCGTFDAAYHAAVMNDTVDVKCGTYPGWTFSLDSKKTGGTVTFQPESTGCVTVNGLVSFGANASYITIHGFTINNPNVTIANVTSGVNRNVTIDGNLLNVGQKTNGYTVGLYTNIDGWRITNNTIGPTCCGYNAGGTSGNSPVGINIGKPSTTAPNANNVTISNNLIQYVMRDTQYWPTSQFGPAPDQTCTNARGCHIDGIHIWGLTNSTISYNRLYGVECQGIFLEPTNGSLNSNVNIIGNAISDVVGGCSNKGIYVNANGSTTTTSGTWNIAFNSGNSQLILTNGCGGCAAGTVWNLTGNAMTLFVTNASGNNAGCQVPGTTINYSYNVWGSGGTGQACGANDIVSSVAFVNAADPPSAGIDLHLGATGAADNFVPSAVCTAITTTDMDGQARSAGARCDAGADER